MGIAKRLEARTRDAVKTQLTREQAEDRIRLIMGLSPEIRPARDRAWELRKAKEKFDLQGMGLIPKTEETPVVRECRRMIKEIREDAKQNKVSF